MDIHSPIRNRRMFTTTKSSKESNLQPEFMDSDG